MGRVGRGLGSGVKLQTKNRVGLNTLKTNKVIVFRSFSPKKYYKKEMLSKLTISHLSLYFAVHRFWWGYLQFNLFVHPDPPHVLKRLVPL